MFFPTKDVQACGKLVFLILKTRKKPANRSLRVVVRRGCAPTLLGLGPPENSVLDTISQSPAGKSVVVEKPRRLGFPVIRSVNDPQASTLKTEIGTAKIRN